MIDSSPLGGFLDSLTFDIISLVVILAMIPFAYRLWKDPHSKKKQIQAIIAGIVLVSINALRLLS